MTVRNVFLSLILSLVLTFVAIVLYVFYPLLALFLKGFFSSEPHTDGIAAVAGGVSDSAFWLVLLFASALFLVIFTLLQRRSSRNE